MDKFNFGENLMIIRKSRRLSQFQLAKTVGLTDKAVSKWENNKAKPSFEIIVKLAGQLNCSTDELIYGQKKEEKKEDLSEKNRKVRSLWEEAERRIHERYGEFLPLFVQDRFLREKHMLEKSDAILQLDLIRLIQQAAAKTKARLDIHGPLYGYLISWLLDLSEVNPLPAHWRCPKCRRTVLQKQSRCGWDLEERTCECGEKMERDGMNLPLEMHISFSEGPFSSVYCEIGASAMEEAEKLLVREAQKYYAVRRYHKDAETPSSIPFSCYFFGEKKEEKVREPDYLERVTKLHNWSSGGQEANFVLLSIPEIKKGGRKAKERVPKTEDLLRKDLMIRALKEAIEDHQGQMEFMEIIQRDPNPENFRESITFGRYITLLCAIHSHYMTDGIADLGEKMGLKDLTVLPTSAEDIWLMILERAEDPELVRGPAVEIVDKICTGMYIDGISKRDMALFHQLNLPDWFQMYARNVMSLVSRSQNAAYGLKLLKKIWEKDQIERGK